MCSSFVVHSRSHSRTWAAPLYDWLERVLKTVSKTATRGSTPRCPATETKPNTAYLLAIRAATQIEQVGQRRPTKAKFFCSSFTEYSRRLALKRVPLERKTPLKRSRMKKRGQSFTPASEAQRIKIDNVPCVVCGRLPGTPAHLASRARGGCESALCVVSLCFGCHRSFDDGCLELLPYLEPDHRAEIAHCVEHLGLESARRRLTSERMAA